MKIGTIISLLLVLLAETNVEARDPRRSHDEEDKDQIIANMMATVEAKKRDIHQYCQLDSYQDHRTLNEVADKLESSLTNDQMSVVSSQGGMIGSLMVATSFIPSPFSIPLFYYGGYLTAASTVGHASNVAAKFLQEDINEGELHSVIGRAEEFQKNIQTYEVIREDLSMLPEGAMLLKEYRDVTFTTGEVEIMQKMLRQTENIVSVIMEDENINVKLIKEHLKFIGEMSELIQNVIRKRKTYERLKGNIDGSTTEGSKYAVEEYRRDTKVPSVSEMKSTVSGTLQGLGSKWSPIAGVSGITSLWNIYNEADNIKSTEQLIRNKKAIIRELRAIASDIRRQCRRSDLRG